MPLFWDGKVTSDLLLKVTFKIEKLRLAVHVLDRPVWVGNVRIPSKFPERVMWARPCSSPKVRGKTYVGIDKGIFSCSICPHSRMLLYCSGGECENAFQTRGGRLGRGRGRLVGKSTSNWKVFMGLKAGGRFVLASDWKYVWACMSVMTVSCICMHMEAWTMNSTVEPTTRWKFTTN